MNNMTCNEAPRGLLLRRNKVDFCDSVMIYELRAVKTKDGVMLSVSVRLGEEITACLFAARTGEVLKFYNKTVKNTVTPCTLADVAEDFKNQFALSGV